ncbi:MAG: PadR family transcriptional regulator [Gemmatimonadetes bacterium]|nr:PadR family transcriptional regulator [Gemmatimonadota bacterium]
MSPRKPILHGTLDTLILKVLSEGALHGYAVARRLETLTDDVLHVEEGSLYPALYRMEKKGLLRAEWGVSELSRRAKFYAVTDRGRRALAEESADLLRFADALRAVLEGGA